MILVEQARVQPVVDIDQADEPLFDQDRHAQDRAQAEHHDAFATPEPLVILRVVGQQRFAALLDLANDRRAHLEGGRCQIAAVDPAGDLKIQLLLLIVAQHQEAALGAGDLDHPVHDVVQYFVQVQAGVECARDLV